MGKSLIIKGADFSANGIAPEFVQLKSIISTASTQYIQSPVDFPKNGKCVFNALFSSNEISSIIGFSEPRTASNGYKSQLKGNYSNNSFGIYFSGAFKTANITINQKNEYYLSNYGFKENDVLKAERSTGEVEPVLDSVPFGIFGVVTGGYGTPSVSIGYKLYSFKMYSDRTDDSTLILDAIPVKRLSDNKICLYDKISGEYLLTNDGTNPDYEELD